MNIEEGVFRSKVYKIEGQKDVLKIKQLHIFEESRKEVLIENRKIGCDWNVCE